MQIVDADVNVSICLLHVKYSIYSFVRKSWSKLVSTFVYGKLLNIYVKKLTICHSHTSFPHL